MGIKVKAIKNGFSMIISEDENFLTAREKIIQKFDKSKMLKGSKFLNIEAESLSDTDILNLKDLLSTKYAIQFSDNNKNEIRENNIRGGIDQLKEKLSSFDQTLSLAKKIINNKEANMIRNTENCDDMTTRFVFENMRSGSEIDYNGNVIVFGDINPGAKIIARGNVIIMGSCRGTIYAGEGMDGNNFIAGTKLKPLQMKINGMFAVPPDNAAFLENVIIKKVKNEIKIEEF